MNYSDLNAETKKFFNKAIDIYSAIENKDLTQEVIDIFSKKNYTFTKLDKRVLALFTAGLLVDEEVKKIASLYDDIRVYDLLNFMMIDEKDIKPIENYAEKFEVFQPDILRILEKHYRGNHLELNYVMPTCIIGALNDGEAIGSKVLEYYSTKYKLQVSYLGFFFHPLFKSLEDYNIQKGIVIKENGNLANKKSDSYNHTVNTGSNKLFTDASESGLQVRDGVWDLLDVIKSMFIGQEDVVEDLFYNIINNQYLARMSQVTDGERSIIFLDGPTGTGKTGITREITSKLDIPYVATSATSYSSTGYKGSDLTDILRSLYDKAGGDLAKAERGIVVIDEFDKIAYSQNNGLEMKQAVQQQLLDFLGGGRYNIRTGDFAFDMSEVQFDTSKLTFICLGALTNLRSRKTATKSAVGFGQKSSESQQISSYNITPQDLIDIGLERELVGRFNTYLHTNEYSRDDLLNILKNSAISPLLGLKSWVESSHKKLEIDDDVYALIADQAYELNTGARSLQTVVNNIRTQLIKEVFRGNDPVIRLDREMVLKTSNQITLRRTRD